MAMSARTAALICSGVQDPIFAISSRTYWSPPESAGFSGGKNQSMRRHAMKTVISVQGRYARNQRLQRTWTPPADTIISRAVIDDAPPLIILSKSPAAYVFIWLITQPN